MKVVSSIQKQLQFSILLVILTDAETDKEGITLSNLCQVLESNGERWLGVGQVRDNKNFEVTLRGLLSKLTTLHWIRYSASKRYFTGKNFDAGLKNLVLALTDLLELDIEMGHHRASNKGEIAKKIGEGQLPFSILASNENKKLNLFLPEQETRLAQLSVQLGCYL